MSAEKEGWRGSYMEMGMWISGVNLTKDYDWWVLDNVSIEVA